MTDHILEAQQVGRRHAVQATLITELVVLSILFTFLLSATDSVDFLTGFFEWISLPTFTVFVLSTVLLSYVLGQKAGVAVLS